MEYKVNGFIIDIADVMEHLQKGYILHVCKIIQEKSGCTLAAARDLFNKMIIGENIQQNPLALEMNEYMLAEYDEDVEQWNGVIPMTTMDKIQFTRLNDSFFSFVFTVDSINYSSGVIFTSPCSDEKFDALKSTIKQNLLWLEENIKSLSVLIKSHLQENEIDVFNETYLVSFSLIFEGNDYIPILNLAYGDDGVYLLASIKNQILISVKLND